MLQQVPDGLFIAGQWRGASSGATFDVHDPATGHLLRTVASATPQDGVAALDAAVGAAADWAATAPRVRSEILRSAFDLLRRRREDFALLITLEMGKPLAEARAEVDYGGEFLRWFAEEAVRIAGRYGSTPEGRGRMLVTHHPVGPCYLITPWNFPLAMATRKIAPALAAGCTVVVKPAELTPLTTLLLATLLQQAGVPAGVVNIIPTAAAAVVSAPILADPRLRKLSFTGSTPVGQALLRQAADTVLRTSMELGGNAPFLVFEDADIDQAVTGAMAAKFRNSGEACTAANRFLVHRSVARDFTERIAERVAALQVGRGTLPGVSIGPLIDARAVTKVDSLVRNAIARHATVLVGGRPRPGPGSFYEPTVLTQVPDDSDVLAQEIFGPVVAVTVFDDEDEAVRLANATESGLAAYVWTKDLARVQRMIDRLETGMLGVNVGVLSNAAAPFGGIKRSGLGREGGPEGIAEYLTTKYTMTPEPTSKG
ncbi:NAD-dependent succinate-semialdehyde dehydrogenase [Nakamurella sp. YIM 132084]|uniref:NAD-dependent succinate-semialdehyde dehydrogenase n=1 Tax=Nakamurella leprariae TaxID=2803911 RepID=A0A939BXG5_9ACTN|nr:NAD-dependent succinate-semialdehyde dehydrogenase [Nakamurella leprariae]